MMLMMRMMMMLLTESTPGKAEEMRAEFNALKFTLACFILLQPHVLPLITILLVQQFGRHSGRRKPETSSYIDIIPKTIPLPTPAHPAYQR